MLIKGCLLVSTTLSMSLAATAASAQDTPPVATAEADDSVALEEITVTAQRRSERLLDVPIAITYVSSERLEDVGISDITNIKVAVPGANVRNSAGYMQPYIRGIGSSAKTPLNEAPIASYVDEVYLASLNSVISFNNIESIEVLKGPQGTLFGRNATGGLFNIRTRDPSYKPTGKFHIGYGNYDVLLGDAYVSTGLSDKVAADFAFAGSTQGDGYGRNVNSGRDVYRNDRNLGFRSKLLFEPDDATRAVLIGDYADQKHSLGNANTYFPGTNIAPGVPAPFVSNNPYDSTDGVQPLVESQAGGVSLNVSRKLDAGFQLKSITAYRLTDFHVDIDGDGTPAENFGIQLWLEDKQFTQELQAQSTGNGPFSWTAGLFYYWARSDREPTEIITVTGGTRILYDETFNAESIAGYAQGTYAIAPETNLTLGARHTFEWRRIGGAHTTVLASGRAIPGISGTFKTKVDKPSFRVAVDHKFTPDVMGYASYNQSFKSGGYSFLNRPVFRPETMKSYELGLKSQLFDRRVTLNLAAFYNDYEDLQVQLVTPTGSTVTNGAAAEIYGLDADLNARLTSTLSLSVGLELLSAKYLEFENAPVAPLPRGGLPVVAGSASGNHLPHAPDYTANIGLFHELPLGGGTLKTSLITYLSGRYFAQPDNFQSQDPYALLNGSIQWEAPQGWSIRFWMNNITDELVLTNAIEPAAQFITYDAPRTYGVTLGFSF